MAKSQEAILAVLREEDSRLTGVVTNAKGDHGGRTRFGIAERFHPELTASGFFDAMGFDEALALAMKVYREQYWTYMRGDEIEPQAIANALMSFCVLEGARESVLLLQRALGVDADGKLGPHTLAAINAAELSAVLPRYEQLEDEYFDALAAKYPQDAAWVNGWKNRAHRACRVPLAAAAHA